ncbi:GAF domain-containing protein [Aquibacillus saliphilus]|uniref:GAF domain-containing protein n=1 Tax=Aquibacillus saliphilus TaxID=1909422 RepID=UPI001CF0B734|nr:GAF domain-containing protein [Aquibacillus saliphilus]
MEFEQSSKAEELTDLLLLECDQLKENMPCDFSGIALQKYGEMDVVWPYVSGNRNEKYKYITVRYGKGIAGKVISSGSSMTIASFPNDIIGKSTEYPIMLAEKIISAYACPLIWKGVPKGALLIGFRDPHTFNQDNYQKVKQTAEKVESLLASYYFGN